MSADSAAWGREAAAVEDERWCLEESVGLIVREAERMEEKISHDDAT